MRPSTARSAGLHRKDGRKQAASVTPGDADGILTLFGSGISPFTDSLEADHAVRAMRFASPFA
jgi:hypothetical protein